MSESGRPTTARQSVMASREAGRSSLLGPAALAAARDSPEQRPGTARASMMARQSGRYSQSTTHRSSRAPSVVRGSVRYRGGGGGIDASGMPVERVLCIDEDGRDRTPKPLIAARPHGRDALLPGSAGWGGSDGLGGLAGGGGDGSSDRGSILSFAPLLNSSGLPTARSFMTSEAAESSREESFDGAALPAGRSAGARPSGFAGGAGGALLSELAMAAAAAERQGGGGGRGSHLTVGIGLLDVARSDAQPGAPERQHAPQLSPSKQRREARPGRQASRHRSRATQCQPAARASRGIQVQPWELRCGAGAGAPGADADAALLATQRGAVDGAAEAPDAADGEEEALLAMQHPGGGMEYAGDESHRSSPTTSHYGGMLSESASRRGSMAGSRRGSMAGGAGRMSMMHGDDEYSRPGTGIASRRTSIQVGGDWSARQSASSSRASFAAALSRMDGRGSVLGGLLPGSGGRASVLARGGQAAGPAHQAVAQPTAAELAAAAARRQKAEQERALARMPGLVHRLQVAEKAVLVNQQHARLAQYQCVLYCPPERPPGGAAGDVAGGGASDAAGFGPGAGTPGNGSGRGGRRRPPAKRPSNLLPGSGAGDSSSPLAASAAGGLHAGEASTLSLAAEQEQEQEEQEEEEAPAAPAAIPNGPSPLSTSRQPQLELPLLWSWQSDLTGELPVSCLAFNRASPGLLAVGYGRLEYSVAGSGLVAVWSLSNPTHPLWHVATPCGVSALDWSSKAAGTLAVGFFDGGISLYDVRAGGGKGGAGAGAGPKPLARAPPGDAARGSGGGHAEPVWRLRYVSRASDSGEEMLVSISSDGRLLEWKHAQGLERSELLRLKRQQGGAAARRLHGTPGRESQAGAEGYLGRAAGGTCFDFCPADPRSYLVGTEDGRVHRCSTAFSEQYIQSYGGHLAPVYQVCWSPFNPSLFLSASADWSVRLWSEGQPRSLWTFQLPNAKAEVADVAFSPSAATQFAAAVGNTLQLWDLEHSVLAPRATATRFGTRLTALAFSRAAPVVVVGSEDGVVSVYSLAGLYDSAAEGSPEQEQEQRQRLDAALRHHTAQAVTGDA